MNNSARDLQVANICAALQAEALFHMSLGSKELFHSNFIAWFADRFPSLAAEAFATWSDRLEGALGRRTEREPAHLDLVLHLPGLRPIALENKVFSVPDERQLDRYADGVLKQREATGVKHSRILLSLISPGWAKATYEGWRLRTYSELADVLAPQVQVMESDDAFAALLLDHYVRLIRLLTSLVELLGTPAPEEPLILPNSVVQELETARISAGIQKARASHVVRDLRLAVSERHWSDIEVDHSFTNGMSLLEAFRRVPGDGGESMPTDAIGWQLQGAQFRLFVVTGHMPGAANRAEREKYVAERYARWFEFGVLEELVGVAAPRVSEVRGGQWSFQGYNPSFVYRYRAAPNLSPAQLLRLGVAYLELAEQLF